MTRFALAILAYAVPTFALGYIWHLVLFARAYEALTVLAFGATARREGALQAAR